MAVPGAELIRLVDTVGKAIDKGDLRRIKGKILMGPSTWLKTLWTGFRVARYMEG